MVATFLRCLRSSRSTAYQLLVLASRGEWTDARSLAAAGPRRANAVSRADVSSSGGVPYCARLSRLSTTSRQTESVLLVEEVDVAGASSHCIRCASPKLRSLFSCADS